MDGTWKGEDVWKQGYGGYACCILFHIGVSFALEVGDERGVLNLNYLLSFLKKINSSDPEFKGG